MLLLDDSFAAPACEPAAGAAPTRARRASASLVLFVGRGCRPSAAHGQALAQEGMRCLWLAGVEQAVAASRLARFDALVLDAQALQGRETAALARLRAAVRCPLVLLAEQRDEVDEIVALELGADAYLLPPVAPRRLRAHLSALLRVQREHGAAVAGSDDQDPAAAQAAARTAGDDGRWHLDRVTNRLLRGARSIELTEVQACLLQTLLDARGRIVPRERLGAALPLARAGHARNVDVYVHRLRRRLRDAGVFDLPIESVRGRGYQLSPAPWPGSDADVT
jgi:DNA-binding response OmpR family regulator